VGNEWLVCVMPHQTISNHSLISGGAIRVPQPLLDFAQIGPAVQRVSGGRGPPGVRAEAWEIQPGGLGVFSQHATVKRPASERPIGAPLPRHSEAIPNRVPEIEPAPRHGGCFRGPPGRDRRSATRSAWA
jgi:hypothetical protein